MAVRKHTRSYDGKLACWDDVRDEAEWDAIVLGNGMSINLWRDFAYGSLYEHAKTRGLLSEADQALFSALGVENFEEVLKQLSVSINIGKALGQARRTDRERRRSIRGALGRAVQAVHVQGGQVPAESFQAICDELRQYRHAFSTSYDLLIYWAAAKGPSKRPFDGFYDFFWNDGGTTFDEDTIRIAESHLWTRLYFLHGALHLVVGHDGVTRKQKASMLTLLDKFERPVPGDDKARPLIVTEARADDKVRNIKDNDYLWYCWRTLRKCDCPLVVFGHSLSEQDQHLVDSINKHPERIVAVSLRDHGEGANGSEKHRIASLLRTRDILFYDAATHPLGRPELRLRLSPWTGKPVALPSRQRAA